MTCKIIADGADIISRIMWISRCIIDRAHVFVVVDGAVIACFVTGMQISHKDFRYDDHNPLVLVTISKSSDSGLKRTLAMSDVYDTYDEARIHV